VVVICVMLALYRDGVVDNLCYVNDVIVEVCIKVFLPYDDDILAYYGRILDMWL